MMQEETGTVLSIEDLKYSVGDVEILKGISLKVKKGELVGLIGPNGAGKTTLLKAINGINQGTGSIRINGLDIRKTGCKRIAAEVALMHQNTVISNPFPAIDIVLTGRYPHLKRTQAESKEDFAIARRTMEYTDTLKFEARPVTEISGGERQRVLFAKVLAQETGLVLLDEPTASLDITHQEQIFKYAQDLCDSGKTVIAAVHDLKIASRYCTRLVLMKDGKVVADGNPEDVLTSGNLSRTYGVNALVYRNRVTGLLDFYIHGMVQEGARKRVHVIGGGGSASGVVRQLFEAGFEVTAGVFAHGDTDIHSAEVFGIRPIVCKPFSDIGEEAFRENVEKIREADITVLCNMLFGFQNLKNLEAAKHADKLVIVEDDPVFGRDFTGGKATEMYEELRKNAVIVTSARLHEGL